MEDILGSFISMYINYFNFKGCTNRNDFWMAVLIYNIISFSLIFLLKIFDFNILHIIKTIFNLGSIIPLFSMMVRRLHDVNVSGWYLLINLFPFIGIILILIKLCYPSVNEGNIFRQ